MIKIFIVLIFSFFIMSQCKSTSMAFADNLDDKENFAQWWLSVDTGVEGSYKRKMADNEAFKSLLANAKVRGVRNVLLRQIASNQEGIDFQLRICDSTAFARVCATDGITKDDLLNKYSKTSYKLVFLNKWWFIKNKELLVELVDGLQDNLTFLCCAVQDSRMVSLKFLCNFKFDSDILMLIVEILRQANQTFKSFSIDCGLNEIKYIRIARGNPVITFTNKIE